MTDVATPAGWYPSPTNPDTLQYWDGRQWTEHTRATDPSPFAVGSPSVETPVGGTPWWKHKLMWPVYGLIGLAVVGAVVGDAESEQSDETQAAPSTATVTVTEPEAISDDDAVAAEVATVTGPAAIATRDDPLPLGQSIEVTAEALGDADDSVWSLTVTGPVRDVTAPAVTEGLAAEPLEGHVIAAVPFELTLVDAGKEPLAPLFNVNVEFFSPDMLGIAETLLACGLWREAFDSSREVFIGGTISGLLCAEVPAVDLEGGLLVTADEEGDRVFLATE